MEVALVLLGFGLSLLTQFATREWVRKDKAKEQHEARMDRYRDQLRVAISEFVSSAASFLLEAHASTGLDMGIQIIKDQDLEVPNELASKGSKAFDDLIAASHSMEAKAVSLLLLLGETSIRDDVLLDVNYIHPRTTITSPHQPRWLNGRGSWSSWWLASLSG